MTQDQQAALEQAAREWLTQLGINREPNPSPDEREWYDDKLQVMVKALAAQRAAGLEEAQGIVESEEELPGDMPEEMFQAITGGDRAVAAETLRAVVRATKKSITSRLKEPRP